jgi:hypothetical protein
MAFALMKSDHIMNGGLLTFRLIHRTPFLGTVAVGYQTLFWYIIDFIEIAKK